MVIPLLTAFITIAIYRFWVTLLPLSSGDWPYLFLENIKEFSWYPEIRFLWLSPYYQILTKIVVQYGGLPWEVAEKLFWFLPFVILSYASSYKFTKSALGSLIYTTNTYALMIVGGGQMGVAMAYAMAPLILKRFTDISGIVQSFKGKFRIQNSEFRIFILNGIFFSIQVMFDPRIALLTIIGSFVYYLFFYKKITLRLCISFATIIGVTGVIHLYWIIPLLQSQTAIALQLGEATASNVKFLSFATLEQTLSLLHPNWPENIFGKVYFMKPEF